MTPSQSPVGGEDSACSIRSRYNLDGPSCPPRETIGGGISEEIYDFLCRNLDPDPARRSATVAAQAAWSARIDAAALPVKL